MGELLLNYFIDQFRRRRFQLKDVRLQRQVLTYIVFDGEEAHSIRSFAACGELVVQLRSAVVDDQDSAAMRHKKLFENRQRRRIRTMRSISVNRELGSQRFRSSALFEQRLSKTRLSDPRKSRQAYCATAAAKDLSHMDQTLDKRKGALAVKRVAQSVFIIRQERMRLPFARICPPPMRLPALQRAAESAPDPSDDAWMSIRPVG
ncbi:hypothetical protein WL26_09930 [Burkholderia cepacia]|nr:hypothetical protein WL26_09930 [Burkholderia cepacia]